LAWTTAGASSLLNPLDEQFSVRLSLKEWQWKGSITRADAGWSWLSNLLSNRKKKEQ
jgi:hypothetical protein